MNKNQNWRKVLSLLCVMIMVICIAVVGTIASSAEEASVITSDVTWNDGDVIDATTISGGTEDAPLVITVNGTVTINGTLRLSSAAISNVRFVAGTEGATLIRAEGFAGQMLYAEGVSGNFHNITFEGITLDGGAVWTGEINENLGRGTVNTGNKATGSVLYLVYTNVTLENSVLQNHDDSTGEKANAVFLRYYSTITFNNSVVRNNASPSGYYSGGVITVRQGGTAKTYNSEVYGNYGVQGGFFGVSSTGSFGGICEVYDSVFHNNFADAGALFDMQCNSNKGYLLIDGCEFYENGSNKGLIYEHAYTRPVIIKDSTFQNNECAIWDCHAAPALDLSGKIVIEGDYEGYFFDTPLAISAPLTEGSHIEMSEATVNKLMARGCLLTGAAGYQVTEADLAKLTLPEGYELVVADVNGDGIGDTVSVAPDQADSLTPVYITIKDTFDEAAEVQSVVYANISCLPVCSFAHEGFTFTGWVDSDGNAVAKQMFSESTTLYATWKLNTPTLKLSRTDATLSANVTNYVESITYTYQWYMDNAVIEGATSSTYTMTDVTSHSYKCEVTATLGEYSATASVSGTSSVPAAAQIGEVKYASLKDALAAANALESATITLYKNVTLGEKLTVTGNVTISGAYTITRADNYTGTLFVVNAGATLTLDGGLVIDGGNDWTFNKTGFMAALYDTTSSNSGLAFVTPEEGAPCATAPMFDVVGGNLVLNNFTVKNHLSTVGSNDGARAVFKLSSAATLTMNNGATVTHCATGDSSTVAGLNGGSVWTINEGAVITGNYGGRNGAMCRNNNSTIIMNGGSINNNYSVNANGSIFMMYGSGNLFEMNGGEICSNYATRGGNGRTSAIYLHSSGKMVMNGGAICHNYGSAYAGIDTNQSSGSSLTISGGAIVDNISTGNNPYHDIFWHAANTGASITGGTFTQDVSKWLSKDTGLVYVNGVFTTYDHADYLTEVQEKLEAGESVVLDRDIVITDYSFVHVCNLPSNTNGKFGLDAGNGAIFHITKPGVVLDLNGHSIIWDAHDEAYCNKRQVSLFLVTGTGYAGETADFTVTDRVGTGKVDIYGMPSAVYVVLATAKATVEGGTWTNYPCATCEACNIFMYPSHGGALYITGGTFEQKVDDPYLFYAVLSSTPTNGNSVGVDYDQTKVVISGGTFVGTNPADIKFADTAGKITEYNACKEGFVPQQNTDGTWGVVEILYTVEMNGVKYPTIYDALNVLQPRETATIKFLEDYTFTADQRMFSNYTIIINAEYVTLDLNGKTITFDYTGSTATCYASIAIYNKGTLTIMDSSEEKTGTIYSKTSIQGNSGPRILWITSAGSATILGGNFISEQGDTMFYTSNSNMDIPTTLYIKGGYFEHTIPTEGNRYRYFNQQNGYQKQIIEISGGTFKHNPTDSEMQYEEGFGFAENPDGTFGVRPHVYDEGKYTAPTYEKDGFTTYTCKDCGNTKVVTHEGSMLVPVAEVNGVLYSSLQDAINACKNGETVKLLVDLELTDKDVVYAHGGATGFGDYDKYNPTLFYVGGTKGATASQNKPSDVNVVIDLNGHSITSTADAYLFIFMDNCKVTLKDSVGGGMLYTKAEAPVVWVVGTETLVTVESGYYLTDSTSGVMHSTHGGDLVIEGGEFKTTADDASLLIMLNSQDRNNAKYFIKGVATVTIKGGIFHGFNPAKVGDDKGASSYDDIKFVNGCEEGFCPVLNENGTYGVAKELTFKGVRLLLKDGIGIYFMLNTADLVENDYVAVFTYGGKTVEVSFADWKHFEDKVNTGILFDGVDAKSIATEVSVVIMSNGMAVSETQSISVKAYAQAILAGNYSADAKALAKALINYGTIANDAISGNQTAEDVKNTVDADFADLGAIMNDASVTGNGYYGSSVNLNTYLGFNFKFLANAVEGATHAVITYNGKTVTVDASAFKSETKKDNKLNLVVIELDKLLASDAAAELTCTVYNGEQVLATATDSVYNYCARALTGLSKMDETTQSFKSEFYKSLVLYIEAAKSYAEAIEE